MFYDIFLTLCNQNNTCPTAVLKKIGIDKSNNTKWSNGSIPAKRNLKKIADYFGVTVEYLKGDEERIKKPLSENEERLQEIYNETADLTDAEIIALKAFVAGLKANRKPD